MLGLVDLPAGLEAAQLGIVGVLFVMWWLERRDRMDKEKATAAAQIDKDKLYIGLAESVRITEQLIGVIERNTESNVALRQEIHELRNRGVCRYARAPGEDG